MLKLPDNWKPVLRQQYNRWQRLCHKLSARSSFFCRLYYACVGTYTREQQAVSSGIERHLHGNDPRSSLFLLRRNTHRLEKGLLMRPRRPIFALDFIEETIDVFLKIQSSGVVSDYPVSTQWAYCVIREYFNTVGSHPRIDRARKNFARINLCPKDKAGGPNTPHLRDLQSLLVNYEDLERLLLRRRSVRWFEQKPVPREMIDKAIKLAAQAPSSCNRQSFHFRIYDNPKTVRDIAKIPMGTRGFAENIPCICVLTGDHSAYFDTRDRHAIYVDAALSGMVFMLALETLGYASCPLNWPDIERLEKSMSKLLGLPAYERPVFLIAFGLPHPEGKVAASHKSELRLLRSYNRRGKDLP